MESKNQAFRASTLSQTGETPAAGSPADLRGFVQYDWVRDFLGVFFPKKRLYPIKLQGRLLNASGGPLLEKRGEKQGVETLVTVKSVTCGTGGSSPPNPR